MWRMVIIRRCILPVRKNYFPRGKKGGKIVKVGLCYSNIFAISLVCECVIWGKYIE